jgi:hypothetical protein
MKPTRLSQLSGMVHFTFQRLAVEWYGMIWIHENSKPCDPQSNSIFILYICIIIISDYKFTGFRLSDPTSSAEERLEPFHTIDRKQLHRRCCGLSWRNEPWGIGWIWALTRQAEPPALSCPKMAKVSIESYWIVIESDILYRKYTVNREMSRSTLSHFNVWSPADHSACDFSGGMGSVLTSGHSGKGLWISFEAPKSAANHIHIYIYIYMYGIFITYNIL